MHSAQAPWVIGPGPAVGTVQRHLKWSKLTKKKHNFLSNKVTKSYNFIFYISILIYLL